MTRAAWIKLLIAANLVLVAAHAVRSVSPRVANAQAAGGLADNYMVVSGRIQSERDALYIVDMREKTLHTFTFKRGTRDLEYNGIRLLERDFRQNRQ